MAGTSGADFHPDLNTAPIEAVFHKGAYTAAYSGFEGVVDHTPPLADWLRARGSTKSTSSASPPTTVCAKARPTPLVTDSKPVCWLTLRPGVAPTSTAEALDEMRGRGVELVHNV